MGKLPAEAKIGLWASMTKLHRVMSPERRRQFYFVLALMIVGAFAELATIGAVLPFLTLLADPASLERFAWADRLFGALGAESSEERLLAATALFVVLAVAAGLIRLQLAWSTQRFVFMFGHELTVEIQRRILFQSYSFHVGNNSSTLIAALDKVQTLTFDVLMPLMQASTAIFISIFITAALIYVDPFTASVAAVAFAAIYLLLSVLTRQRLASNSAVVGTAYDERIKVAQETLGGIREVIIDSAQPVVLETFRQVDARLSIARSNTGFLSAAPRFVIEAFGMVLIALLANVLAGRESGLAGAIPILGALALGAQRLLPLVQQIYSGWTLAAGNISLLPQVLGLVSLPVVEERLESADVEPLPFDQEISFDHVSFAYPGRGVRALEDATFDIARGSTVGLIGKTGSGKSTVADLLMGLLEPTEGRIMVDGVAITDQTRQRWWKSIAHVPQAIFLADDSIARNIAFGVHPDNIDMERVMQASATAQLQDFISSLPDGYDTTVGERGIRLSGGQRQRVGIARAIYKRAPVLVLDEATSALDDETEAAVIGAMRALGDQGRTVIMIAHRLTSVAACDLVVRLVDGRVEELGSYEQVIGRARRRRGAG